MPLAILLLLLSLFSPCSRAAIVDEVVTFEFAGRVTQLYDPFQIAAPFVQIGDPVSISLRYRTGVPDLYPNDPTRGTYLDIPGWLKIRINGMDFERTLPIQVTVAHGFSCCGVPQEFLEVLAIGATAWPAQLPVFPVSELLMSAWEVFPPTFTPGTLFTSDELPTYVEFARAASRTGFVRTQTSTNNMYEITFAYDPPLDPVPEPATWLVTGSALLAAWMRLPRGR